MKTNRKLAQYPNNPPFYRPPERNLIHEPVPRCPCYKTPTSKQANQSITKELRKLGM